MSDCESVGVVQGSQNPVHAEDRRMADHQMQVRSLAVDGHGQPLSQWFGAVGWLSCHDCMLQGLQVRIQVSQVLWLQCFE